MSLCGGVQYDAIFDCDNPVTPGVLPQVVLMNRKDISSYTYNGNVIESINMKPGKSAYLFEGVRNSVIPSTEQAEVGFASGYRHMVTMHNFDISSTQKENLERLALGEVVAIIFNVNQPGNYDSWFEIYGTDVGMELVALTRINNDLETGAAFRMELRTADVVFEPQLPKSMLNVDYPTTLQDITDLLVPPLNVAFPYTFPFILS